MKKIFLILNGVGEDDGNPNGVTPERYAQLQKGVKRSETAQKSLQGISAASQSIPFIGPIISTVAGIGGAIAGGIKNKKAKEMAPGEQDPAQIAMINRLRALRQAYSTGSEASEYRDTLNRGLSAKIKGIGQQAGGSTGQIMAGIAGAQDKEQEAYNGILATLEKNRLGVLGLENQGVNDAAQRALDVNNMYYNQRLASGTGALKTGQSNVFAGLEGVIGGVSGLLKNIKPSNNTNGSETAIPSNSITVGGGGGGDADNSYYQDDSAAQRFNDRFNTQEGNEKDMDVAPEVSTPASGASE